MKAQTQIKIGVWTAIVMAGLFLFVGLHGSYLTMQAMRREYAIAAQKKAHLEAEARRIGELRAKTQRDKSEVTSKPMSEVEAEPVHSPMQEQDIDAGGGMKIDQKFQLEAQQNISYVSILFSVRALFIFFSIVWFVLFAYSAHREFFWMNTSMLIIMVISVFVGLRRRNVNLEDSLGYLCFIFSILVLLLQPMLGMLRESKQRVENPQSER